MQPTVTAWTWSAGATWASNPRQLPGGNPRADDDVTYDTKLLLFDERTIARHRWRSLGDFRTQIQNSVDDLTDALVSFSSGPVFEIGKRSRLHVAPGGSISWLDGDWLYRDAHIRVTFETVAGGATQSVSALYAHRDTNSKFRGNDGTLFQLTGRLAKFNKFRQGDTFYLIPRLRISEASGSGPGRVFSNALFPGNFVEAGTRLVYYFPVFNGRMFLGAGAGAYHRSYDQNVTFATNDRKDWFLEPIAHLILRNFKGTRFDFRVDYRYEHNDSNDPFQDFQNHVVGARTVRRF